MYTCRESGHVPVWQSEHTDGPFTLRLCFSCGEALPFPSANDTPADPQIAEAMAIEQRAAEIAADWDAAMDMCGIGLSPMESLGACSPDGRHIDLCRSILDEPGQRAAYLAGWLAHAIAHHDEEQAASAMAYLYEDP